MDLIIMKSKIRKMSIETFLNQSTNQSECFTFVPIWLCLDHTKDCLLVAAMFRSGFHLKCRAVSLARPLFIAQL